MHHHTTGNWNVLRMSICRKLDEWLRYVCATEDSFRYSVIKVDFFHILQGNTFHNITLSNMIIGMNKVIHIYVHTKYKLTIPPNATHNIPEQINKLFQWINRRKSEFGNFMLFCDILFHFQDTRLIDFNFRIPLKATPYTFIRGNPFTLSLCKLPMSQYLSKTCLILFYDTCI